MKVIAFSRIIVVLALAGAVPLTAGTSPATRTAATSPPAATQVLRTATRIGEPRLDDLDDEWLDGQNFDDWNHHHSERIRILEFVSHLSL